MAQKTDLPSNCCWITQITSASYLPGALMLAYTLQRHGSIYPLIIQYTSAMGAERIEALRQEGQKLTNIKLMQVELLEPRPGHENTGSVATRFKDTFTKLRAFEVYKFGYSKACFLDADMAMMKNPDVIMRETLPSEQWIGMDHACVCNLDQDPWADSDWHKGNCAYTTITHPDGRADNLSLNTTGRRSTYQAFNGGMFLFHPSLHLWTELLTSFNCSEKLSRYQFPDQEFLADFFDNRILPLSWKYNAIKTMRYCHPAIWRDDEVIVLHYIVDKPWDRRVSSTSLAGYLGRDGISHQWWWDAFNEWAKLRQACHDPILNVVSELMETQAPISRYVPLPQCPGTLEDVKTATLKGCKIESGLNLHGNCSL